MITIQIRTTVCEIFLNCWRSSQNLEDTEVHAPVHISQNFYLEPLTKVVSKSRKHSVCTHCPKRPKLRSLLLNQNDKGSLLKTHWRCSTSSRKVWCFDNYEEWKKVLQQYCYKQDWMKNGGLILWNAIAICEMSKTSWQKGKLLMKDDLENHSKGR